jgi:hypothetical protein
MKVVLFSDIWCAFGVEAKDPFLWWSKHEGDFSIVAKLAKMILGILGSQIET